MSTAPESSDELRRLLEAARAGRNFAFGLVVGLVVAAGLFYARVLSPAETVADPLYYVVLAAVLGLSIALLLAVVLSAVTLYRLGTDGANH